MGNKCCIKKVPDVEIDVDIEGNNAKCCFGENDSYECVCPSTCCVFTVLKRFNSIKADRVKKDLNIISK